MPRRNIAGGYVSEESIQDYHFPSFCHIFGQNFLTCLAGFGFNCREVIL